MVAWSWMIAVIGIGALASILLIVLGVVNEANYNAAFIAFTCAAILLAIKRVVAQPRTT